MVPGLKNASAGLPVRLVLTSRFRRSHMTGSEPDAGSGGMVLGPMIQRTSRPKQGLQTSRGPCAPGSQTRTSSPAPFLVVKFDDSVLCKHHSPPKVLKLGRYGMEDHNATVWGLVLKTQPPSTEHPGQTVDSMSQGPTVCTRRSQFDVRHPQWTHTTPSTSRNPAPKVLLTASRCAMELRSRTGASV